MGYVLPPRRHYGGTGYGVYARQAGRQVKRMWWNRLSEVFYLLRRQWQPLLRVIAPILLALLVLQSWTLTLPTPAEHEMRWQEPVLSVLGIWLSIHVMVFLSRVVAGHSAQPAECRQQAVQQCLPYLVTQMLYFVVVVLGMILLVLPGVWLGIRLLLAPAVMVHEALTPIEALKRSFVLTQGRVTELLGMLLLLTLAFALPLFLLIDMETGLASLSWPVAVVVALMLQAVSLLVSVTVFRYYDLASSEQLPE